MPVDKETLAVGWVVANRLLENQSPAHTRQLWRGNVLKAILNCPHLLDAMRVIPLENGREKETEFVLLEQIVAVEKQERK